MDDATAHILVVGDATKTLKVPPETLDTIAGDAGRVIRTVLRSEVLRILASGPLDLMITASDASFLGSGEFLAAFASRRLPVHLLMLTRTLDEATRERLRSVGAQVEHVPPPITLEILRERVRETLRRREHDLSARPQAVVHQDLDALIAASELARPPPAPSPAPTSEEILPPPDPAHRSSPGDGRAIASTSIQTPTPSSKRTEEDMANINKTLEETMKIDGAIGAAIADWDSGLCLGTVGGGARLNIEIAAAGNCQVVKAKMSTMNELGIKGSIQDILITLEDQIHLIRPLKRGENMFMYLAIDKTKGNLAMARHRLSKLETELSV